MRSTSPAVNHSRCHLRATGVARRSLAMGLISVATMVAGWLVISCRNVEKNPLSIDRSPAMSGTSVTATQGRSEVSRALERFLLDLLDARRLPLGRLRGVPGTPRPPLGSEKVPAVLVPLRRG